MLQWRLQVARDVLSEMEAALYSREEIDFLRGQIKAEVIRRESSKCFLCRRTGDDVHEIVPRSRFGRRNADLCFSMRNSVLLCRECHSESHTRAMRTRLIFGLEEKYGYSYEDEPFIGYKVTMEDADG